MNHSSSVASALVFDCDGLLADTQACWDTAFIQSAQEFGLPLASEDLARLRGASVEAAAVFISDRADRTGASGKRADSAATARLIHRRLLAALDNADLQPLPGVEATLHRHGLLPRAVASNAPREALMRVLERLRLHRQFQVVLSAEDVPAPKPAPDSYILACAGLGVPPAHAIALEDSLVGITSALAAGLSVIAVTGETTYTPANLTVRSLADKTAQD